MALEIVNDEIRDEIMKQIFSKQSNQRCFDCGARSPRWSSPYLGILLCIECAGRHRSYGTHISFVKSVDLDKWNKKQLKSLELTGNFYTKKKFEQLGIPKIDSVYDYNNNLILEYRKELEKLVKESLKPDDYTDISNIKKKDDDNNKKEIEELNDVNKNNIKDNENEEQKVLKPVIYKMKNENIKNIQNDKKVIKKNKIKKIDIDFNFDDYKETTSTSKNDALNEENDNKNDKENVDTKNISGMKLSRKDKKKQLIEQKNKKNNSADLNKKKTCCEKLMEYIYNICNLSKDKK